MRIFVGRAGSGKTTRIMEELAAACERNEGRQLLIVPELFSHDYERRLARATRNHGARTAEVLSFTRLAVRVFAEAGGLAETVLTPAGRLLTLREAVRRVELDVCASVRERPEALRALLTLIDECKTCEIAPEALFRAAEEGEEPTLAAKLRELAAICTAYDRLCEESLPDPRDRLSLLADRLGDCPSLTGAAVYIDCFASFTPQEHAVIRALLDRGNELTVSVTCDRTQPEVFISGCKTVDRLRGLARKCGVSCEVIDCGAPKHVRPADLSVLERAALLPFGGGQPSDGVSVQLFEAATPYEECEHAAAFIRRTIRETGARWRDFVVTARSMEGYSAPLQMAMARYDVPIFLSEKSSLLVKPALALVTGALDACAEYWRYEELFTCFKTGLCGLEADEVDRLENYVLTWRIRGGAWERPWTGHPRGYGIPFDERAREQLAELNALRERAITPFAELRAALKAAETAGDCVTALYAFLERLAVAQALEARAARHEEAGRHQQAEEYRQLWEILVSAMEQFVWTAGTRPMTGGEFAGLFALVLGEYDVGAIPVSLDRVNCGEIDRVCTGKAARYLVVLGVNDGLLPKTPATQGLLTDSDREALDGLGVELAASGAERLLMEQETIYHALSCPTERLVLSYAQRDMSGKEQRPSALVGTVLRLLEGVPYLRGPEAAARDRLEAERPALELAAAYLNGDPSPAAAAAYRALQADERLLAAQAGQRARGPLTDPRTIEGLYGRELRLTASRVDTFYSCRFAFFMQYGLRADPRRTARFAAPETGTFIHYVLENCLRVLGEQAGGAASAPPDRVRSVLRQVVQRYIDEELGGLEDKTARFRYLFGRLVKSMGAVLDDVLRELRCSDFAPIDMELDFSYGGDLPPVQCREGETAVSLSGKVDRVDGYMKNGRLYLRVMDYKSGKKSFSLSDIWYGLNMQLIIYLYALQQEGLARYRERLGEELNEIVPAGVLYVPARDELPEGARAETAERLDRMRVRELRRSGLLIEDMDVLEAMEHGLEGRFIPVSLRAAKKGEEGPRLGSDSAVADLARLGRLARHTHQKLIEMGRELRRGSCEADPYLHGQKDYCAWCPYRAACRFDESMGDRKRIQKTVKDSEFWERTGGEGHVDE